ncbi:4'-phosphopantetheinyl transferase family protein [Azomonas macrocytogenes]|uniref:Enterobactin synthase component D n=1 Tax=Azomonas macrocytogenes TaxID=69962 RepID=A0A839SWD6_AZOMA|nr:4'-phosphopantetheinyl transferase superfamily protein [Azomonas macrocytogenes]MBB3101707.1 enterobactin synthetase component D [Azomonas macrocytogenes]
MSTQALALSCGIQLQTDWPLPCPLPGIWLSSTDFEPTQLDLRDFERLGIAVPRGVPKRQAEYLAGRCCARESLLQLTGQPTIPGKTADRAPCWPPGVVGSITHTHGWAAAMTAWASDWQALGLDAEILMSTARADHLAREILTPGEYAHYRNQPESQRGFLATLTFSLKESLFKALYPLVGKHFYFQDAELLTHTLDGQARMRLLLDLSAQWRTGSELTGQFALQDERLLSLIAVPTNRPTA